MYLIVIGWTYVALMMAVAEATSPQGTVLGAIMTFVLYGIGPIALVIYLLGAPLRRRALRRQEQDEQTASQSVAAVPSHSSGQPHTGGEPPRHAVAPERKEP